MLYATFKVQLATVPYVVMLHQQICDVRPLCYGHVHCMTDTTSDDAAKPLQQQFCQVA